jgi:hypothetical protein
MNVSQTLRVLSREPEISRRPSGVNAKASTCPSCPTSVCRAEPVVAAVSQIITVRSNEPLAKSRPSGENAVTATAFLCPESVAAGS